MVRFIEENRQHFKCHELLIIYSAEEACQHYLHLFFPLSVRAANSCPLLTTHTATYLTRSSVHCVQSHLVSRVIPFVPLSSQLSETAAEMKYELALTLFDECALRKNIRRLRPRQPIA